MGVSARESDRGERMGEVTRGGGAGIDKGGETAVAVPVDVDRGGADGDVTFLSGTEGGGGAWFWGVEVVSVTVGLGLRGDLIAVLGLSTGGGLEGGGVDEDNARFNDDDTGLDDEEEDDELDDEEEEVDELEEEEGRRETGGGGAGTRGRMLLKLGAELER